MRTKQDYVLNQKDGKFIPEKVGLKAVQRDGLDYEFTLVFDIDIKHFAVSSKDRTGLFMDKPEFTISESTGLQVLEWCNSGSIPKDESPKLVEVERIELLPKIQPDEAFEVNSPVPARTEDIIVKVTEKEVYEAIQGCNNVQELVALYKQFPQFQVSLRVDFEAKKSLLTNLSNPNNFSQNGKSRIQ